MNYEAIFSFGIVVLIDNIAIAEMKPEVSIDMEEAIELYDFCESYFKGKPYALISRRINSYSINPLVHLNLSDQYNIKAFAVITDTKIGNVNACIEKHFFTKPFEVFKTEENAIEWVKKILES